MNSIFLLGCRPMYFFLKITLRGLVMKQYYFPRTKLFFCPFISTYRDCVENFIFIFPFFFTLLDPVLLLINTETSSQCAISCPLYRPHSFNCLHSTWFLIHLCTCLGPNTLIAPCENNKHSSDSIWRTSFSCGINLWLLSLFRHLHFNAVKFYPLTVWFSYFRDFYPAIPHN